MCPGPGGNPSMNMADVVQGMGAPREAREVYRPKCPTVHHFEWRC